MLKMVDGTGIIGVDMVCPLGGAVSPPQPPNYDNIEMEGVGSLMLPNSLKAPIERVELLGNSVQGENPAPDNPKEIKSAGRKSKNLFNKNTAKQGYEFGSAATDTETINQRWFVSDFMPVKEGVQYYISGKTTGAGCKMYNKDKVFVKNMQASFGNIKFDEGIAYFRINGEIKDLDKIQIEEGIVATDYKPYGYLFDVKVTGKNLFDINNYVGSIKKISESEFHTEAKWGTLIGDINLKAGGKYNISYTFEIDSITNSDCGVRIKCTKSDGTVSYIFDLPKMTGYVCNYTKSAVVPVGTVKCEILLYTDVKLKIGGTFKKLMIAEDSENVALNIYEPYTEQSMQIALDEPLRGIGEYKDVLTKDGVVRKIKRVVLDGSEDEEWRLDRKLENHINFALVIKGAITVNTGIRTMMDKFKYLRAVWNNDLPGQDMFGAKLRINMPKTLATDLQTFKTWLSQNPLTVDYVLAEPVTEPLPESVQAQLQALHSENGVTHVFVDSGEVPCGIKLTYQKEK